MGQMSKQAMLLRSITLCANLVHIIISLTRGIFNAPMSSSVSLSFQPFPLFTDCSTSLMGLCASASIYVPIKTCVSLCAPIL